MEDSTIKKTDQPIKEDKVENKGASATQEKILNWLKIALVIVAIYAAYRFAHREFPQIKDFILNSGPYGLVVSTLLFGLLGATPIPSEPLTILLSTIYGPFWAMIATSIGNLLSALVEYFISGELGSVANFDAWREKLPFGLSKFPVDSPVFLIGARIIPGYGSKFVSLVSGFYHVPLWRYIWTTFTATLMGAAVTAYAGYNLVHALTTLFK
jgi:uncharacterized membrane protein YdjX (TVP38/TMEM64 family)